MLKDSRCGGICGCDCVLVYHVCMCTVCVFVSVALLMMTKLMNDVTQDGGKLHRTTVATCATTYMFFVRDRLGEQGLLLAHVGGPMGRTLSCCM